MAEFREIDSYLTESDDSSYEDSTDARPSLAQTEFDNSVLKMGKSLLTAAQANPIEGTTEIPKITLRLTRLDPSPTRENGAENDPRIAQTIHLLQEMGIDVKLGEWQETELLTAAEVSSSSSSPAPTLPLEPTININLDLSVLIALISDLTHAPLPKTVEDAKKRFVPPPQYREFKQRKNGKNGKNGKKKADPKGTPSPASESVLEGEVGDIITNDLAKHARALMNQLLQEMGKGLLQEMRDQISPKFLHDDDDACQTSSPVKVRFWTTPEARDRCLRIIAKIGGESEKRRTHAMFSSVSTLFPEILTPAEAEELYWKDSRYPFKFIPLFPIIPFPPSSILDIASFPNVPIDITPSTFSRMLAKTCKDILAQETMPHPRALPEELTTTDSQTPYEAAEIQRAIVTKANPRLTAHTVQSLLWGAELGWTTLTANRTSIKAILREVKLARVSGRLDGVPVDGGGGDGAAAIWIVDPRSLAEGMSSPLPT